MVGDWIADKHGFPVQVLSVSDGYLYVEFEDDEGNFWEFNDKDNIPHPVLLTDEFFKRNDFDEDVLYWTEGCDIHDVDGKDGYLIMIRLFNPPTGPSASVHYVHELQQLLRLGGYTELANDVKL
jgi:hypothetical protein